MTPAAMLVLFLIGLVHDGWVTKSWRVGLKSGLNEAIAVPLLVLTLVVAIGG